MTWDETAWMWGRTAEDAWRLAYTNMIDGAEGLHARYTRPNRLAARDLPADDRLGPTLFRVSRACVAADGGTRVPEPIGDGFGFAFVTSSPDAVWSKAEPFPSPDGACKGRWWFETAAEAVARTDQLNDENERYEGRIFRTFLLMWQIERIGDAG